jgi:hypothetical protein
MLRRSLFVSCLTVTLAAALGAQDLNQFCRPNSRLTVGQYSTYHYTGGSMDGATMRMAIVGSEKQGDSTFQWFEIKTDDPQHPTRSPSIIQILGAGFMTQDFSVHGFITKSGTHPAMRAPDMMIQMMAGPVKSGVGNIIAEKCRRGAVTAVGTETIRVPGGSFRAVHFQDDDGDIWLSRDLVFPLVKLVSKKGETMELTGHGGDAKSSITETPQSMMGR